MKTLTYNGRLIGVFQKENDQFFARLKIDGSDFEEIDFPVDREKFHQLKFGKATLTLNIE